MAEEGTGGQSTEGMQAPDASANAAVDSSTAVKLQGGGSGKANDFSSVPEAKPEGQTSKEAPKPAADGVDPAKAAAKAKEPETKPIAWDPTEQRWLESKGIKTEGLDPSNEAVKTLIKNARNAESEASKLVSASKAKEIAEQARNVKAPDNKAPERRTKIDEFEEFHGVIVDNVARSLGVSADQLAETYPDVAARMTQIYAIERQKSWEREQQEQVRLKAEAEKAESDKQRFLGEIKESERQMSENLLSLKAKDPETEKNLESSGVMEILKGLEKDAAWPVSFVLSNPKTAEWFARAAKAIKVMESMSEMEAKWKQSYEKQLKEQEQARLVGANEGGQPSSKASFAANVQKSTRSGF